MCYYAITIGHMAAMNVSTNYIEKEENVWLKLVEMLSKMHIIVICSDNDFSTLSIFLLYVLNQLRECFTISDDSCYNVWW